MNFQSLRSEISGETGVMILGFGVQYEPEFNASKPGEINCEYCRTRHAATNCPNCGAANTSKPNEDNR